MKKPEILVICPTPRDLRHLSSQKFTRRFRMLPFGEDVENPGNFDALRFYQEVLTYVQKMGRPDGIIGDDDYPAAVIGCLLAESLGLPGPSPESVFLCQHKYYSRCAQKRSVPEAVPDFFLAPFHHEWRPEEIPLPFPFFIKPVKGYLSILSRSVRTPKEFKEVLEEAQKRIPPFVKPFDQLFRHSTLNGKYPAGGENLIAEEIISGRQVTLEGYVWRREVRFIDIVDSIFYPGTRSFKRFQCPSSLPPEVQTRMFEISKRFIQSIGFDNSLFNVEFVYHPRRDTIHILEVNGRMASQFADMMEAIHGTNTYEILVNLVLGRKPCFRRFDGKSKVAASFVLRTFEDQKVESVPSGEDISKLRLKYPEARFEILVEAGKRLSEHFQQDDESYRYALINLSAKTERELFRKFRECEEGLPFQFSP